MKASYSSREMGSVASSFKQRIAQPKRWLRPAGRLLLAQDVGDIVGAEGAGRGGFFDGAGTSFGSVLPYQFQQFGDLAAQRPVGIGHVAQISLHKCSRTQAIERIEQPLLRLGASGRRPLLGEQFFKTIGSEGLAAPPRTRIADDLFHPIVDGDGTGVGLEGEPPADVAVGHAVAIAVERKPEVFMHERFS